MGQAGSKDMAGEWGSSAYEETNQRSVCSLCPSFQDGPAVRLVLLPSAAGAALWSEPPLPPLLLSLQPLPLRQLH